MHKGNVVGLMGQILRTKRSQFNTFAKAVSINPLGNTVKRLCSIVPSKLTTSVGTSGGADAGGTELLVAAGLDSAANPLLRWFLLS